MRKKTGPSLIKYVLFLSLCFVVGCSVPYNFSVINQGADLSSTPVTNKEVVPLQVTNFGQYTFTKIRMAEASQYSPQLPAVDFNVDTAVDLMKAYAPDGSKDGLKNISADLYMGDSTILHRSSQLYLDTVPPVIQLQGILKDGVRTIGIPAIGSSVNIRWTAQDPPAPTGYASGLSTISYGWTQSKEANCDPTQLNDAHLNLPYSDSANFIWPNVSPTDAFYICILVSDRGGNSTSSLSAPMTNLWGVLAGDNNQGNGASLSAKNVRFNYPSMMLSDSKNNIYVLDNYFHTLRKISVDRNGNVSTINLFAGNGLIGNALPSSPADPLLTALPSCDSLSIDSKDQIYIATSLGILRIRPDSQDSTKNKIETWLGISGYNLLAIDPRTNDAYYHYRNSISNVNYNAINNYIFKFTTDEIDNLISTNQIVNISYLKANKIFAGNGNGAPQLGTAQTDSFNNSPRPASDSIDYPLQIAVGESGELFVATLNWFGQYVGHDQLRLLKKDAQGNLQSYLLMNGPQARVVTGLQYIHETASLSSAEKRYLLAGTGADTRASLYKIEGWPLVSNLSALPISPLQITVVNPISSPSLRSVAAGGMAAYYSRTGLLSRLFVTDPSNSRILTLKPDLSLEAIYGRPTYDSTITVATESVINNPGWLAEGPNREVYFLEYLNDIIRKVSSNGIISLVAGQPNVTPDTATLLRQEVHEVPIDQFLINGTDYIYGLTYPMVYQAASNSLFMGYMHHNFLKFDLNNKVVTNIVSKNSGPTPTWNGNPFPESVDNWGYIKSLAIAPGELSASTHLTASRFSIYDPRPAQIVKINELTNSPSVAITGFDPNCTGSLCPKLIPKLPTNNSLPSNSNILIAPRAAVYDSAGNYYFEQYGNVYKINPQQSAVTLIAQNSGLDMNTLALFEEKDANGAILSKEFFGTNNIGNSIRHFSISNTSTLPVVPEELCLPATYLNAAVHVLALSDGSLGISDTKNSRILKYFVHGSDGKMHLVPKTDPACPQI